MRFQGWLQVAVVAVIIPLGTYFFREIQDNRTELENQRNRISILETEQSIYSGERLALDRRIADSLSILIDQHKEFMNLLQNSTVVTRAKPGYSLLRPEGFDK